MVSLYPLNEKLIIKGYKDIALIIDYLKITIYGRNNEGTYIARNLWTRR